MTTSPSDLYDLCIIGGGINGAGIARDAAGRGLKTILLEQGDLAQATSSASSKMIHGGLRYLEYYEFRLVRESLMEREVLLKIAPHIIHPITLVLPLDESIRPYWMVRAGLFLYDHLVLNKTLPSSRGVEFGGTPYGVPLRPDFERGFSYSDCWVDDARLVVLNAMSARDKGADIRVGTRCIGMVPFPDGWTVTLQKDGQTSTIRSRTVINAAGPWVRQLLDEQELSDIDTPAVRLVQGSHIIVPRLYQGDHCYLIQRPDGRVIFIFPYEKKYTLIGTTETAYKGDPLKAEITAQEMDYLLSAVNEVFRKQIAIPDIVRSYSGVRPLFDDEHAEAKAVTRDYKLYESDYKGSWMLSAFGGKITTYRKLAEHAVDKVADYLNVKRVGWTHTEALPGGELGVANFAVFLDKQKDKWPTTNAALIERYARAYGTNMDKILNDGLGNNLGNDVFEGEIRYLVKEEFARGIDDIIWRRSKLGLHISEETRKEIERFLVPVREEIR